MHAHTTYKMPTKSLSDLFHCIMSVLSCFYDSDKNEKIFNVTAAFIWRIFILFSPLLVLSLARNLSVMEKKRRKNNSFMVHIVERQLNNIFHHYSRDCRTVLLVLFIFLSTTILCRVEKLIFCCYIIVDAFGRHVMSLYMSNSLKIGFWRSKILRRKKNAILTR